MSGADRDEDIIVDDIIVDWLLDEELGLVDE